MAYEIVIGSAEPMPGQLVIGGSPLPLELTDTLTLLYRMPDGVEAEKVLTIADASQGTWLAEWVAGDLPVTGGYTGKIRLTRPADSTYPRFFPDDGSRIIWWVYPTI